MVDGAFAVADAATGEAVLEHVDADFAWDGGGEAHVTGASVEMFAGPRAQAAQVTLRFQLDHGHLSGVPEVEVSNASASPIRGLELTGIHGTVAADPGSADRANLDLRGSYFGADRELWRLSGWFDPNAKAGELKLRADRFKLGKLKGLVQTPEMMNAKDAELDGHFDVSYKDDVVKFGGAFHVAGLTIAHPMLAPVAVSHIGFDARTQGSIELAERKLHLVEAVVDYRNVHASLAAEVENLGHKPRFMATLKVRPMPCQLALAALPPEVVPNLEGFKLTGTFSTDLHLGIDLEQLETPVDLGGLVGIEGCKVVEAPPWVDAEKRLSFTFLQTVQSEPGKWITFLAGPENPDWVPYDQISPHLINSIMTTEDNGFFKHHGFISSEFRSALQQNLQRGYFRLGASSITMQMVKNVLLSREKTLSRKLQEMFLTWYVEHHLTKERILEIYFNVIEFGPGIYGIGRAVRHYFGKAPKDLEPQEAAFFSSILPNPKRRYVQYCHKDGTLDAKWDAYVKRIMRRNHERGRLTDAEYEKALATPFHFDRAEAMPERDCVALVKRITTPLVPPDAAKN
jgi:CRISPR/Cas system endoribonuclease Cas6 (RAMP superfamily)